MKECYCYIGIEKILFFFFGIVFSCWNLICCVNFVNMIILFVILKEN